MVDPTRRLRMGWHARLGLPTLLIAIVGCGGGQEVTPEAVRAARELWTRASLPDYDLDWSVSGPNNAHYFATVRGGEVRKVEMIRPDGGKVELHPEKKQFFGVDGLFLTMEEELAVCSKNEKPFGQPKGTRVVMRFQPDVKLGYPHWYHRDVLGSPMSMAIDVNALTPAQSATNVPGPDPPGPRK
jgi:hypothetical protein